MDTNCLCCTSSHLHFSSAADSAGVDEYQSTVSATYTVSIMGCSLAAVADMSHLHGVRKKNTVVSVHCTNFLQLSPLTHTRGHPYKLLSSTALLV